MDKKTNPLHYFFRSMTLFFLTPDVFLFTIALQQGLSEAHNQFKNTLPEADLELRSTVSLMHEVERICQQYNLLIGSDNPFTSIKAEELVQKWNEVKQLIPMREKTLHAEIERQERNERLRRQFAQRANIVGQWIEQKLDLVSMLGLQRGSLEDHLAKLTTIERELTSYRRNVEELEACNNDVQEAMIFENRHTPYTMEVR